MKKILFVVLSVGLFIASCTDKNTYTLTGNLPTGNYDGRYVYLRDYTGSEPTTIDSVQVSNKQFTFKGSASDTSVVRYIDLRHSAGWPFVLEKGNIELTIDSLLMVSSLSGTPANNFLDKLSKLFSKIEDETDVQKQKILFGELRNTILEYVKPNITTPIGETFFLSNSYYLYDNDILELIAASSPQFKEKERVQRIEALAKARITTGEGATFVNVKGLTQDGKEAALSDYAGKGKVVLVDFWASWCGPCIRSLPDLKATCEKYKDKGFEVVGISLDDDGEAWKAATEKHAIVWPQFSNLKGWSEPAAQTYGINAIPHAVLIDQKGIIVLRGIEISKAELENKLDELLK